jgi:hypothetical protein
MRKPMTPDTLRAAGDGALLKARGEQPPAEPAGTPTSASALASRTRATDAAAGTPRPFEVWMFNGLRLRHVPSGDAITVHRFDVRHGNSEQGQPVVVEFTEEVAPRPRSKRAGRWMTTPRSGSGRRRSPWGSTCGITRKVPPTGGCSSPGCRTIWQTRPVRSADYRLRARRSRRRTCTSPGLRKNHRRQVPR